MKKITVYLEDSFVEDMEQRAKKNGKTFAGSVREAIETGVSFEKILEKLQTIENLLNEPIG